MEVAYLESLVKDLKKIKDKKLLNSLSKVFVNLEKIDDLFKISSVKKMSGHPEAYRIRIGDYRLGFYYTENQIEIARFLKRNDIYKVFP
jgi:mRNA interferase RelE/StbE|tara:strand:+ start:94 stop:360 length:267 start_codon:yes stop_codon:yes gene_type:complete